MKIMLFIGSMATGGAERQFAVLAAALHRQGHELRLVTMQNHCDDPGYCRLIEGIEHRVILGSPWPGPLRLLQLVRGWRPLRRVVNDFGPDVIYSALEWPNWLASRAVRRRTAGPAVVVGIRNSAEHMSWKRRLPVTWLRRRGRVDGLIANSQAGVEECHRHGLSADLEAVIPNGINTTYFRPVPEQVEAFRRARGWPARAHVVGHVGRLSPMKDHDSLLRSFALIASQHADTHFVCVGRGPEGYRRQLLELTHSLDLDDRVHWLSHESDLPALYSSFDVLVMSSRDGEGFPNVVAEAMACGTPCVVTDVGDAARVVGDAGLVVPPSAPGQLATAVQQLVAEDRAGSAARSRIVQQFGVEAMVAATVSVLQSAASSGPDVSKQPPGMLTKS